MTRGVSELKEEVGLRIVALLVVVAAAAVAAIWTLDTKSSASQSVFAVYLAIDLVSFAMISYVYRETKGGDEISRLPLLAGCVLLVILVAAGFAVL
ncbi:MAG: hypothetical protein JRM86_02895 [Nitrososphaerota archaeon]|jgi:hypothetical protein|nr:hypothetical protein [Nitrososphaerota archaeon]MDG6967324.1 hypothetical protein [Nitrososphaerota archaeon]MDG6978402.1 hypothetical protein [Nitrososphaerota archaeon]MDG7005861.1 hypothetical protein [Nitrososphaerota archaeon]MDG7020727.1 hypothetical protein [Nitrososphaerota archaeon]